MKIRPMGAKMFHADGQTNTTNPTVAFQNFANGPKNAQIYTKECPFYHVPVHRPLS